jgi:hypothetical protein
VYGIPLLVLKPILGPRLDRDTYVGITIDRMSEIMLGILVEVKEIIVNIPQMETLDEMGKYGVG